MPPLRDPGRRYAEYRFTLPRRGGLMCGSGVGKLSNMPTAGKKWRHVIVNTRSSWLPGDVRGFRNRGHRLHSSGDYRHPPPPEEHEGLYKYNAGHARGEIRLPRELRPIIGKTFRSHFLSCEHCVLAVAVTKVHAHALVELPDNIVRIRAIVGNAKRISSRAVKQVLKGSIWSAGGSYTPVESRGHHRSTFDYILYKQGKGAWTWSCKDGGDEGQFDRMRPDPTSPHAGAE
jgi:hypothetical protein